MNRVVRQAADSYARAARAPYARIPRPTPAGNNLRQAARLLSRAALVNPTAAQAELIVRLAALAEAVVDLRQAQRLAAQAAAVWLLKTYLRSKSDSGAVLRNP